MQNMSIIIIIHIYMFVHSLLLLHKDVYYNYDDD